MSQVSETVEKRNQIKKRKPHFLRQDVKRKKRLSENWRRPKGLQSKMRLKRAGYAASPSPGYGSPVAARGLDRKGRMPHYVACVKDIESATKEHLVVLSSSIGQRKRLVIVKKAMEKGLTIEKIPDLKEYIAGVENTMKKQSEDRKEKASKKEKKKKEREAEAAKKKDEKTIEETLTDDEKKQEEKKEMDRMLTQTN